MLKSFPRGSNNSATASTQPITKFGMGCEYFKAIFKSVVKEDASFPWFII